MQYFSASYGWTATTVAIRVPVPSRSSARSDAERHFIFDEEPEVNSTPPVEAMPPDHLALPPGQIVKSFIQQTYHPFWSLGMPGPHTVENNFQQNIAPVYSHEKLCEILPPLHTVLNENVDDTTLREQLDEQRVNFCGLQPAVFLRTLARVIEAHLNAART